MFESCVSAVGASVHPDLAVSVSGSWDAGAHSCLQHLCEWAQAPPQPERLIPWGAAGAAIRLLLWPCLSLLNISGCLEMSFPGFDLPPYPQNRRISKRQ